VFQSFIMTTARYKFSVYEKRILYRLVEIAQSEIQGVKLKDNLGPLYTQRTLFGGMDITLSFSSILDVVSNEENRNNHYECLKSACRALAQKIVEWEDLEQGIWKCQHLIEGVEIKKRVGVVTFSVPEWFWHAILDFSKGYRKYELLTAMKLKSPYSMRFFELMSGQKRPFTLSVEEMRKMFGLEGKYERPSSIRERIIEPAKKELDASAPYSFDVKEERSGKGKTSPISAFTFIPRRHEENQDKDLLKTEMLSKLTARNVFKDKDIYEILKYTFEFDSKEINKNKQTIDRGKDIIPDFVGFLSSLSDAPGYKNAIKKKGYVIQAIKNKTKETLEGNNNINAGEAVQATPPKKGKYTRW
jgi:plasmid replication initiation protein